MKLNSRLNTAMAVSAALAVTALALVADGRVRAEPTARDVASVLEQGDMLTRRGRFDAARAIYESAAEMVRSEGELPGLELRRIANAYYFEGQYREASATLEQLADEARALKNTNVQALAIADAVWMSVLAGSAEETQLRQQLRELSDSSLLSEGVRDAIGSDPAGDLRVFAPHITAG
jgi:tetratricopeptide (TPR) repeat protein